MLCYFSKSIPKHLFSSISLTFYLSLFLPLSLLPLPFSLPPTSLPFSPSLPPHLLMFIHKVQILEGGASLAALASTGLPLVGGALQVVLLVVADAGGQQVVHHHDTDVHAATLGMGINWKKQL